MTSGQLANYLLGYVMVWGIYVSLLLSGDFRQLEAFLAESVLLVALSESLQYVNWNRVLS